MSAIAIVKPNLEDRAYRKAGVPDYQNVETIAAILTWECECYKERDFNLYSTVLWNAATNDVYKRFLTPISPNEFDNWIDYLTFYHFL